MREIPLNIEGFEGRNLKLIERGVFKSTLLSMNGQIVKSRFGKFLLKDNNGQEVEGHFEHDFLIDLCSAFRIKGQKITIREPLAWYQYVWGGWPLLLIFSTGAIGGALMGAAMGTNIFVIFRSKLNGFLKYLLSFFVSISAVFLFGVICLIAQQHGLIKAK
jgi:hypothetical protein